MDQQNIPDTEVATWLKTVGIESLCQWDVLVFLYRHRTSLAGADYLGRLLGYGAERVAAALDVLDSLGLVERSRVSQGARLYKFTDPPVPPPERALERLLALAGHRAGRLLLTKELRREQAIREELQARVVARSPDRATTPAGPVVRREALAAQGREDRRETWLKVI